MEYFEVNFDGLVGPLHHYAGLAKGNLASELHSGEGSNPRAAAHQGLDKMVLLREMGLKQGFFPPLRRPAWWLMGNENELDLESSSLMCSSSSMWVANSCTVVPSIDTNSAKLSFVTANLLSNKHREIESGSTYRLLKHVFPSGVVLPGLRGTEALADEGAANYTRLSPNHSEKGLHLFVYGNDEGAQYRGRQSRAASEEIVRKLQLDKDRVLIIEQSQKAIDHGVFHNDVISTGNNGLFIYHEDAFEHDDAPEMIVQKYRKLFDEKLRLVCVRRDDISLGEAVESYLFNSQIVTLASGRIVMIAPQECKTNIRVGAYIEGVFKSATGIDEVIYIDLAQSMKNGGGPACLRLRVVMNEDEFSKVHPNAILTNETESKLRAWVDKYYPEHLQKCDLLDLDYLTSFEKCYQELDELMGFKIP